MVINFLTFLLFIQYQQNIETDFGENMCIISMEFINNANIAFIIETVIIFMSIFISASQTISMYWNYLNREKIRLIHNNITQNKFILIKLFTRNIDIFVKISQGFVISFRFNSIKLLFIAQIGVYPFCLIFGFLLFAYLQNFKNMKNNTIYCPFVMISGAQSQYIQENKQFKDNNQSNNKDKMMLLKYLIHTLIEFIVDNVFLFSLSLINLQDSINQLGRLENNASIFVSVMSFICSLMAMITNVQLMVVIYRMLEEDTLSEQGKTEQEAKIKDALKILTDTKNQFNEVRADKGALEMMLKQESIKIKTLEDGLAREGQKMKSLQHVFKASVDKRKDMEKQIGPQMTEIKKMQIKNVQLEPIHTEQSVVIK